MNSRIYIGDSRKVLPSLYDELVGKVALTVTSPPYFVGRGYEEYIETWEQYWEMLYSVFRAVGILTEPHGKVAINFADKYANSKDAGRPLEIPYIPSYAVMMHDAFKFDLWARIIWDKVRVMIDGARHTTNKNRYEGSMRVAPNWEYIFVWRKYVKDVAVPKKDIGLSKEDWREYVNGIWRFSSVTSNRKVGGTKLAMFPTELPSRLIKMYTEPGDIVLDPFVGTGTTVAEARRLGRIGIGVERNPDMLPILQEVLQPDMFSDDTVEYIIYE